MFRIGMFIGVVVLAAACAVKRDYLKDSAQPEPEQDDVEIVEVPKYPEAGRAFHIHRTYTTNRSGRANRRTPPEGYRETLKVVDAQGTLEFWRDGEHIHTIELGPCLSFAEMDRSHDFQARGKPAYMTVPSDCRVWDGRTWQQTYETLVPGWFAPCVYETRLQAMFQREDGNRVVRTDADIEMTMEKNGSVHNWSVYTVYDPDLRFFRKFNVGYVGEVRILEEITEG